MGIWSKLTGRRERFEFSNALPSTFLRNALHQAEKHPIDDFTWRIVIASPKRRWIIDISLPQADAGFTAYARVGLQKARLNAASIILDAINGRPIDDATMASASLAFFDIDFTIGANKGKTRETAWNTLALDVECKNERLQVTRDARRLSFPVAPSILILLTF